MQPVFDNVDLRYEKVSISGGIKAECRTETDSESIFEILGISSKVVDLNGEVKDGVVKYDGKIIFYFFYKNSDGNIVKTEIANGFSGEIKDDKIREGFCSVSAIPVKTEADTSSLKVNLIATLKVKAEITFSEKVKYLSGGDGLILKKTDVEVFRSSGVKTGACPVDGEFDLSYAVKDVLSTRADAVITSVTCGVGTIVCDGEIYMSSALLQNGEKGDIIKETKTFPFRAEIDCEEAVPSMKAIASANVKSFKTDVAVDEENDKSKVTVTAVLSVFGEAFSAENVTVIDDLFSATENLKPQKTEVKYFCGAKNACAKCKISERAGIGEVEAGYRISCAINEKADIISHSIQNGNCVIEGVLSCDVYLTDGSDGIKRARAETPFTASVNTEGFERVTDVFAAVKDCSARLINSSDINIDCDLVINVISDEIREFSAVTEVISEGEKEVNDHAISVYIPTEGEDLWTLSKRLNVCPEDLVATNRDLQFPLSGKERIIVYRQK